MVSSNYSVMHCDDAEKTIAAYAVGALEEDSRRLESHIHSCLRCTATLNACVETAALLGYAVPQLYVPSQIKKRLHNFIGKALVRELERYKELLESNPEREEVLQGFMQDKPELLCPTHVKVWPKLALGARKTDFVFREASGDLRWYPKTRQLAKRESSS